MSVKNNETGKTWYELKDVIKIAQGFAKEENFTVLPNYLVKDIVAEMERLSSLQDNAITNGKDLVLLLEEAEDCGCSTCKKITGLIMKEKGLKE